MVGIEQAMEAQRERAREASQFGVAYAAPSGVDGRTLFSGYESLRDHSRVLAIYRGEDKVTALNAGELGTVVLDRTPFYAEAGGQAGDRGVLQATQTRFNVSDTKKLGSEVHGHVADLQAAAHELADMTV